jgi:hypothetical protein
MPTLLEILQDPNYINANPATKKAIFDKYAPQDSNYVDANDATKAAIRQRFGLSTAAPAVKKQYGVPLEVPPEDKEGFVPAVKAGYESLKGSLALAAGKAGLMDLKEAERYQAEREAEAQRVFTPTEKGWSEAPFQKFKETLGGSLPYMAAPIAAAAGAAALPVTGTAATLATLGATGLVSATQFTGTNLARQLDEVKRTNPNAGLEQTSLGSAVAAAIPQTALDIVGMKAIPLVRGLFKSVGKEVTEQQAKNFAEQGFRRTLADYSLATGKAAGVEGATETGQQFLERLQAGLNIADADARKEYVESFIGGAVLGGALSPAGRYIERRREAKTPEERSAIDEAQAKIDAEQLAKQKEDLQGKAAAVNVEDIAARTQELAKEPATAGDVLTAATQAAQEKLAEQATPEQKVAEAATKVDALTSRINELTDEYIAAGDSPDQAKIKAAAQAAEEERNDQEADQALSELAEIQAEAGKEAEDAAKAIEQGGGESVPIPSRPDGGVPTGGVEPPVAGGVERPARPAEPTVRGEEVPSGAVEEKTQPPKEIPSVTTPTETKQAKEEGAAASAEGTEVAKPATTAKPVKVVKQPSGKNAAGESIKNLELSNGEKVQIIRRDDQWVREDDGVVTPVGKTLKEAVANVTGIPAEPQAKRGPKPKLTEEEKTARAIQKKDETSVLNFFERLITSTKKQVDTGEEGLAVQLDRFFGPRPETPKGPRKTYETVFEKQTLNNIIKSQTANPEAQAVLRKSFYENIYPALEILHAISTTPKFANTRVKSLAEEQFNRAPIDIRKLIETRVKGARAGITPDFEQKITELEEAPSVQETKPAGPAPTVTVKKKRTFVKPEGGPGALAQADISETELQSTSPALNPKIEAGAPKTGKDAAQIIAKDPKSNKFERTLAQKLVSALGNIKFIIVSNKSKQGLIDNFKKQKARGLFIPTNDMIVVAGSDLSGVGQGVNNQTVLHELLHAGTAVKIYEGEQIVKADPRSTDPRALAYRKLVRLMAAARDAADDAAKLPNGHPYKEFVKSLDQKFTKGKALTNVYEFLTYGMTDGDFQQFLSTVQFGKTQSVMSTFVATIRQLLGLSKNDESALANLIEVTDTLLSLEPSVADAQAKIEILSQKKDVQTAADVQVKYANDVINTPRSQGPSVSALNQAVANGMDLSSQAELAGAIAEGAMSGARKHILGAFTPSQLAKLVKDKIPALTRVVDLGRKFNAKRQQYVNEMKDVMKPWLKLQRNDREQSQLLATIMHLATVNGVDPSIPAKERVASTPQSDTLDDLWEKLGEPGREIYISVRDYYADQYEKYKDLLNKRIEMMGISDEEKTKFMDLLKKQFESDKVAKPYFPLMRYGENWLRVGKGKDMEFYMFESASERNRFAIRRAKEMGKPLKDLYADGTLKRGDQLKNMMEESFADTTKLKEVLAAVDKLGIDTDKASIKDEIYQMYLLTLPEKSFRKQFIHRKNTAGFSADALRNFGTAGFRMSNQLAKMEYQPQIVNTLDEARESIKDDPDASKYRPYIEEVAADFDAAVNPKNENSILNFAANGLSTLNFFYYMSSISSALTNMTSLPVFGYPTLLAEYGKTPGGAKDVHKELVRFMNVYKEVGFRRKVNGKTEYVMPSIRNALTNADEIKAYDEFAADNLFSFNRSMDLLNIVKSPSQEATNPNILKVPVQAATDAVSTLFSMTEQLPREMMAMAAYRLGRSQGLSHDEATKKALDLTHDAMYDYSMFDTPRYFRGPVGRTIFQFKKFSQNTAFYLTTNFLQIFKGADPTIRKQAATRFFGTLGMTGMFAGLTGMPLYTVMSTVAEKVLSAFGDDDDDEDSAAFQIRKYGFDLWFKKWLSENFGANVATYVAMGPVTGLTGADFNSRVKLNDLLFQDWEFKGLLGPSFGMFENAQRAYDRFKEGQTERAIETMMPAFIRQPLKAYRFSEEGVKTPKGYEVVAQEDLNWMDIAMQSIGYAPIKVSAKQTENFKLKKLEQEREEERTELLKRSVYARRGISDEDPDDIQEDIDKFNSKFPNRRILPVTIMQSDQARRRQERAVDQGLYIANPMNRRELLELRAKE